jgi:hypothetical protein
MFSDSLLSLPDLNATEDVCKKISPWHVLLSVHRACLAAELKYLQCHADQMLDNYARHIVRQDNSAHEASSYES